MKVPLLIALPLVGGFVAPQRRPRTTQRLRASVDDVLPQLRQLYDAGVAALPAQPFAGIALPGGVALPDGVALPAAAAPALADAAARAAALAENPAAIPAAAIGLSAATMAASGVALFARIGEDEGAAGDVYPSGRYDPEAAARYFSQRPLQTLRRFAAIAGPSAGFGARVALDVATGSTQTNEATRAAELLGILAALGPTFIKVGQALSIRSDLLSEAYCEALATLQDACPPFDDAEARALIAAELGVARAADVFEDLTPTPIASASLGQVYRGYVDDGDERVRVAVKVQRPDVAETIALDLHLLRVVGAPLRKLANLNTDLVGIVDAWGVRFVDELDYRREAKNARNFIDSISQTPLADAVFAPKPVEAASSRRVLATRWVDGQRLDADVGADDDTARKRVSALCGVAMNAYLTMMLETGLLHADPHPGNLIVEADTGRLAILDWGLVTELDPGLQVAYIEHIAHLVAKDYASVPADLVKLGFVPEGYEEAIAGGDAVQVLSDVYTAFAGGGGAAKIDVPEVVGEMRALADRQGNLFRLPPYFAYIARAFSVLEGIGLQNDPDYAIVGECLPYVSQRLLSDPSPRVAGALDTFVYGADGDGHESRRVDSQRLNYLLDGLQSYTAAETASAEIAGGDAKAASDDALGVARKLADLLLADGGAPTPLQAIVEREFAKLLGASARTSFAEARKSRAGVLAATLVDPFGVLEPIAKSKLLAPDRDDKMALATLSRVASKASPELASSVGALDALSADDQRRALGELADILWRNRAGASLAARRIATQVLTQSAARIQ